jgi:hypothetical protein
MYCVVYLYTAYTFTQGRRGRESELTREKFRGATIHTGFLINTCPKVLYRPIFLDDDILI